MSVLALNHHNTPVFTFIDRFKQIIYGKVFLLNVYIRHTNFVKVLYFIVGFSHDIKYIPKVNYCKVIMRQKHKSNVASFQLAKGGAIPTLTHQRLERV